jgi:hypothetical protein
MYIGLRSILILKRVPNLDPPSLTINQFDVFNKTIYKPLALADRFNVAFPNNRIPNGYIDKTKTRLGITYTCFHDERDSISVIPSVPIIDDALLNYPYLNLFEVKTKVTPKMIADYLESDAQYKRLVTTPESFEKIIFAAMSIGKLQWLYDCFFLYLDEIHCYATEAFRDDILKPFDYEHNYVYKFKNRAMGTATTFRYSDPRIQNQQQYKMTYTEKFGKITIINNYNPQAVIHHMLTNPDMFPGNVYIFFNSVKMMGQIIKAAGISNVNVYCRHDERNMGNLEDCKVFFKEKPLKEEYQKFNFFSCRYNEGWDLKDDSTATIILLTDVRIPHSLIGIPFKGYQAVGRLQVQPHTIYHITNNFCKTGMRSFEAIQEKCIYNANKQISYYNEHIAACANDNMDDDGRLATLIKQFAGYENGVAKLYHMGVDQVICAEYCKEHYSNIYTIKETWETLNYETEFKVIDLDPVVRAKHSKEQINKQVIDCFELWKYNPGQYEYGIAEEIITKYKLEFAPLYEAYLVLGADELLKLNYNDKAMKTALIQTSNNNSEVKLRLALIEEFRVGSRYTKKYMKDRLQQLFNSLGIKKPNGCIEVATAEKLYKLGLFELEGCKTDDGTGKLVHAFEVTRVNYCVTEAT